jgi:hypothetical protein
MIKYATMKIVSHENYKRVYTYDRASEARRIENILKALKGISSSSLNLPLRRIFSWFILNL